MWQLARATFRVHRSQYIGVAVVVTLVCALLGSTFSLLFSGFSGTVAPYRYAQFDAVVTAAQPSSMVNIVAPTETATLPQSAVADIAALNQVSAAAGEVSLAVRTDEGTLIEGRSWALAALTNPQIGPEDSPQQGQIIADASLGFAVGQQVTLSYGAVPGSYQVVGLLDDIVREGRPGGVYFSPADTDLLRPETNDFVESIGVVAAPGTSKAALAAALKSAVPQGVIHQGTSIGDAEFADVYSARSNLVMLSSSFSGVMMIVALSLVVATTGLAVQQRRQQFALLRAVGAKPSQLRQMVATEVLLVAALAAPVGALLGVGAMQLMRSCLVSSAVIPADFGLANPIGGGLLAVAITVFTAWLGGFISARRVAQISPVDALREAAIEVPAVSRWRTIVGTICAIGGVACAIIPLFLPGTLGAVVGMMSALLFILTMAMVGPQITQRMMRLIMGRATRSSNVGVQLAAANCVNFSRRISAAIIPLALCLSLGCVQIYLNGIVADAAVSNTQAASLADVTAVNPGTGIGLRKVEEIRNLSGVAESTSLVRTTVYRDEMDGEPIPLEFNTPVSLVGIELDTFSQLMNLNVVAGSLEALAQPGTVALSRDSLVDPVMGLGSRMHLTHGDSQREVVTVVAVYSGSEGLGDVLMDQEQVMTHKSDALVDAVLLRAQPGQTIALSSALEEAGLTASEDVTGGHASAKGAEMSLVSVVLLLAMLVFVALVAVNTLVMATSKRRDEFRLLSVIGVKKRQVRLAVALEALVIGVAAIIIGSAAFLPSLFSVQIAAAGFSWPHGSPLVYLAFAATMVVLALVAVLVPASRLIRRVQVG